MIAKARIILTAGYCLLSIGLYAQPVALTQAANEASFTIDNLPDGVQKPLPFDLPTSGIVNSTGSGKPLFSVNVKRGKLNGQWQSWYANGVSCDSGKLVNNLPDGEWIFRNEEGEIRAIRHYSADKFQRIINEMQRYHPKRSFYYLATMYQKNKRQALQFLDAGYSFPDSRNITTPATLQQLAETNTSSGFAYDPVFVQCVHDGLYMNYFPGGIVKDSGMYKEGLKSGKWIHRDSAQSGWFQGAYKHGLPVKEWKHFDQDGRLFEILFYDQSGRLHWRKKINRQPSR